MAQVMLVSPDGVTHQRDTVGHCGWVVVHTSPSRGADTERTYAACLSQVVLVSLCHGPVLWVTDQSRPVCGPS